MVAISSHPGHLLVFDCEGGNNAMSKSHSIVTVARASKGGTFLLLCSPYLNVSQCYFQFLSHFPPIPGLQVGALFATALIFVTDGKASEAAIEALARMLEECADGLPS